MSVGRGETLQIDGQTSFRMINGECSGLPVVASSDAYRGRGAKEVELEDTRALGERGVEVTLCVGSERTKRVRTQYERHLKGRACGIDACSR